MNIGVPLEDGSWVTQEMLNAAQTIYESFPDLELMWLPRADRKEGEPVFAIVHRDTREVMFYVQKEEDLNNSLVQRIHFADTTKFSFDDQRKRLGVKPRKEDDLDYRKWKVKNAGI